MTNRELLEAWAREERKADCDVVARIALAVVEDLEISLCRALDREKSLEEKLERCNKLLPGDQFIS